MSYKSSHLTLFIFVLSFFHLFFTSNGLSCVDTVDSSKELVGVFNTMIQRGCDPITMTVSSVKSGESPSISGSLNSNSVNLTLIVDIPYNDTVLLITLTNFNRLSVVYQYPITWPIHVQQCSTVDISGMNYALSSSTFEIITYLNLRQFKLNSNGGKGISLTDVVNSAFEDCQLNGFDAGITDDGGNSMSIKKCEFRGNKVAIIFSGILELKNSIISGSVGNSPAISTPTSTTLKNVTFDRNRGGCLSTGEILNMADCVVSNNINGGISAVKASIRTTLFQNNTASSPGGSALYLTLNDGSSIYLSNFTNNSAKDGGAIYTKGSINIFGCIFKGNNASGNGGALYIFKQVYLEDTEFTRNSAKNSGGAIFGTINVGIVRGIFKNNSAVSTGGAIYGSDMQAYFTTFSGNSLLYSGFGGAVCLIGSANMTNVTFEANSAEYGAGIKCVNINSTNSVFKNNRGGQGSAVFAENSAYFYGVYEGGNNFRKGFVNASDSSISSVAMPYFEKFPTLKCDWVDSYRYGAGIVESSLDPQVVLEDQRNTNPISLKVRKNVAKYPIRNITIGTYVCNVTEDNATNPTSLFCPDTLNINNTALITSDGLCFADPIYAYPSSEVPTIPPTSAPTSTPTPTTPLILPEILVKELITNIVKESSNSSITSVLYSAITSYFNSTANSTNPLVVASPLVSISAFDVSRKLGSSISLSLSVYNSSTVFPNSVMDEILSQFDQIEAFFIFTTYEKIESQITAAVPKQGSVIYGLTLVDDKGRIISVSNTSSPISLSLAVNEGLSDSEIEALECLFWDELESQWKSEGCTKKSISKSYIECECYHLTNFSAGTLPNRRTEASLSSPTPSPFPLAAVISGVVGGIVLLLVIAVIVVILLKRKSKDEFSNMELSTNMKEMDSRLVLKEKIGQGSSSIVYRAIESGTTTVAVKKLLEKKYASNFMRESNILKGLHHPNIVQYLDTFEDEQGLLCLMLEYMNLGNLLSLLQSQSNTFDSKLKIAIDIIGALKYLESNGIIHCDISARNVLIRDGPTAKLGDFGLAREISESHNRRDEKPPVRWSAPEVLKNQKYSHASDVWMYGVLLWEIWSDGKIPYGEMTNDQVVQFVIGGGKLFPPKDVTHKYLQIIQSCIEEEGKRIGFKEISSQLEMLTSNLLSKDSDFTKAQDDIYVNEENPKR